MSSRPSIGGNGRIVCSAGSSARHSSFPFVWFLWRGWIERGLKWRLWALFALGAMQGAVGWWMVASGLAGRVSVSQYRLAFHLTLACVIYAALVWTAQRLRPQNAVRNAVIVPARISFTAQIVALSGADCRSISARWWPGSMPDASTTRCRSSTAPLFHPLDRLFFEQPLWRNFFENPLMVQFQHRMLAYVLVLLALAHLLDAARNRSALISVLCWCALGRAGGAHAGRDRNVHADACSADLARAAASSHGDCPAHRRRCCTRSA